MNNKKITMMLFLTALTTAGAYAQGNGGSTLIPEGELQAGSLYSIAHQPGDGNLGLVRLVCRIKW